MPRGISKTILLPLGVVGLGLVAFWALRSRAKPPAVNVGNATGKPGDTVVIEVRLENGAGKIVATSNDIAYDSTQVNVRQTSTGVPDCTITPRIGSGSGADKTLLVAVRDLALTQRRLTAGVLNLGNQSVLPDGALFTCSFAIAPGARRGRVTLENAPGTSDVEANEVAATGTNGTITVE